MHVFEQEQPRASLIDSCNLRFWKSATQLHLQHLSVKSSKGGRESAVIPYFLHEGYNIHFSDSVDGPQFKS